MLCDIAVRVVAVERWSWWPISRERFCLVARRVLVASSRRLLRGARAGVHSKARAQARALLRANIASIVLARQRLSAHHSRQTCWRMGGKGEGNKNSGGKASARVARLAVSVHSHVTADAQTTTRGRTVAVVATTRLVLSRSTLRVSVATPSLRSKRFGRSLVLPVAAKASISRAPAASSAPSSVRRRLRHGRLRTLRPRAN